MLTTIFEQQRLRDEGMREVMYQQFRPDLKNIKIDIPIFKGEIKSFKAFKATFNSVIARSRLDDIEKLTLLRSKVKGEALERISHLQIKR